MKPVEEIAQWIADRKCRGLNDPDTEGCPAQPDQCECEMLDAIAAALRAERERAEAAEALVGIRTQATHEQLERAERAERGKAEVVAQLRDANDGLTHFKVAYQQEKARAEKAEEDHGYLTRCLSDAVTRANKAEEERDRCRRDKMARLREVEEARAIAENAEARADRLAEALRSVEVWFLPEIHEGRDPMFAKVRAALAQEPKT